MSTARSKGTPRLQVPTFALYGEPLAGPGQELLHVEAVQSRSRLYRWEIDTHVHQGLYQVVWIAQGGAQVVLDAQREAVQGPAAIVVPPGVVHGFRFAPGTDGTVLTLSPRFLLEGDFQPAGEAFRDLFSSAGVVRFEPGEAADRLEALLHALGAEFTAPGAPDSPVVQWLARAVTWRLAQAQVRTPRSGDDATWRNQALFTRFTLLVEAHFQERWPLARYASRLGLSTARLNRLVRAEAGRSALEVVHERLTREACRRLAYIAAPAATLAAELGFEDPAYFNRFFKRRTGLTPQRWRKAHQAGA
ncbi:helix-turn-helix domain-containing protein [Ramlibacter sp. MAHUQ-53]|uniref:helix-turn-helix domain-containing protein n=1 Tax=unclassified Ramlibacter TaxID=2617605 RepID=UPI00363A3054